MVGAYVYEIVVNGVVRYVGKGRRYRAVHHFWVAKSLNGDNRGNPNVLLVHRKLAKAMRQSSTKRIFYRIVANGLTDAAAFEFEVAQIAKYPKRQLWNISVGGGACNGSGLRRAWSDPELRSKWIAAIAKGHRAPDYRERARKTAELQWSDLEKRANFMKAHRAIWDNAELAAERRLVLKAAWSSNAQGKEKVRSAVAKAWTPERRAAMAENRRRAWADPEFKARVAAKVAATRATMESKERMARAAKNGWLKRKAEKARENVGPRQGSLLEV